MNAKQKILTGSFALAALFLGFFFFAVWPQISGIIQDTQDLISQKQERIKNAAEQNNLEDFRTFSGQHAADMKKFKDQFIDPQNPIGFLTFLETIANQSGFELKTVPGNPQKVLGDPWPSIVFQIASKGSFERVRPFLQKLENGPYAMEIKNITVGNSTARGAVLQDVDFSLSLKVYTQ